MTLEGYPYITLMYTVSEMDELGYEDYFYGDGVCLVEWANLISEIIPEGATTITIEKDLDKGYDYRIITIEGGIYENTLN